MRIAICDDESIQVEYYKKYTLNILKDLGLEIQIDCYKSGNILIESLETINYDIIFLDINMPTTNGYEVARTIRKLNLESLIIFLTNNMDYVFDSFKFNAFRYVLKYKGDEVFYEALLAGIKSILESRKKIFTIKTNGKIVNLKIDNIFYFEVCGRTITTYTNKKSYISYAQMYEFEEKFKNYGFIRVHYSYLVNVRYIHFIDKDNITMLDGTKVPISRSKRNNLRKLLLKYGSESNDLDSI